MQEFDRDGDNEIDFNEFYSFVISVFEKVEEKKKENTHIDPPSTPTKTKRK